MCGLGVSPASTCRVAESDEPFQISLAEWSLNRTLRAGGMTNLDFPRVARQDFGIDCIEFVDQFFADKARDQSYLAELKQRAEDEGVAMGLIMIDTNGPLGATDATERSAAVEATFAWIDAAHFLGCHTVRVNAWGDGEAGELRRCMAESGVRLADYAAERGLNVVIENHGGPSSDPDWLVSVVQAIDRPNFGLLPDFGNFPPDVDRYDAVERFMPYAKAVSAKAMRFTDDNLVRETDFFRMMRIVRDGGYTGHVGIESGARTPEGEPEAIRKTRDLLLRIRDAQRRRAPLFNGRDLEGWVVVEGGDWTVEDGVLVGRNGRDWSTDPGRTGSWLRTAQTYGDFRLELQYAISEGGNSGVFVRSAAERNPAFTGYEMQICDAPGQAPSKHGPSALYDVVAPTENRVRPAGEWNTVTVIARGDQIAVEMNGRRVIDTTLTRSRRGYVGLQNHDARAVVRFRSIRIERL